MFTSPLLRSGEEQPPAERRAPCRVFDFFGHLVAFSTFGGASIYEALEEVRISPSILAAIFC